MKRRQMNTKMVGANYLNCICYPMKCYIFLSNIILFSSKLMNFMFTLLYIFYLHVFTDNNKHRIILHACFLYYKLYKKILIIIKTLVHEDYPLTTSLCVKLKNFHMFYDYI